MRAFPFQKVLALVAISFLGFGCSKSNHQSVTIQFPDWNQLQKTNYDHQSQYSSPTASATIEQAHIISLNANGKLISGFPWEAKKNGALAPTSATFDAEIGSLVQAMAILETSDGARAYYYGDAKVVGSGTLDLYLSNVLTTTAGEGKVIGRYITGTENGKPVGPTGAFQYRLDPSAFGVGGRPTMVVTMGEAFNGWVSVTTLPSNALIYTKPDGSPMFQLTTSDNSLLSAGATQRAARIEVPKGYRNEDHNSGYDMRSSQHNDFVVGFFGPGADAYAANHDLDLCFPYVMDWTSALGNQVPRLYRDLAASNDPHVQPQTPFLWSGKISVPAPYADRTVHVWAGGLESGQGTCPTATDYEGKLGVDVQNLASEDEFLGVRGPFSKVGGQFSTSAYDTAQHKISLSWFPLPGVSDVIGGWSVFSRLTANPNDDDDIKVMDGYDCTSMHAKSPGFTDFIEQQIPAALSSTEILNVSQTDSSKTQIIVCPRAKDGTMFNSGLAIRNNQSGGNSATALAAFAVDGFQSTPGAHKPVDTNSCTPVLIQAVNSNGTPGNLPGPVSVLIQEPDAQAMLYADSFSCDNNVNPTNSLTINNFSGRQFIWMLTLRASGGNGAFSVSTVPGNVLTPSSFYYDIFPTQWADKILTMYQPMYYAQSCSEALVVGIDSASGAPARIGATGGPSFDFPIFSGNTFYSDGGCSTFAPDLRFPSDITSQFIYFRYTGVSPSLDLHPLPNESSLTAPGTQVDAQFTQPGSAARIQLVNFPSNFNAGSCQPVHVEMADSNHHSTTNDTGSYVYTSLSIPSGNGHFYQDPTCSGAPYSTQAPTIPMGGVGITGNTYFKADLPGTSDILVEVTSPTGIANDPARVLTIGVNPSLDVRQMLLAGPEQYFNGTSVQDTTFNNTSTTPPLQPSTFYGFRLYSMNAWNTQAALFADTIHATITTAGVTFANGTQDDDLVFSGGQAYFNLAFDPSLNMQMVPVQMNMGALAAAPSLQTAIIGETVPVNSTVPVRYRPYGSLSSAVGVCSPMMFVYENASGVVTPLSSNPQANFYFRDNFTSPVGGSALGVSGDQNCTQGPVPGAGGGMLLSFGERSTLNYYQFGSWGPGFTLDFMSELYQSFPFTPLNIYPTGGAPGSANQLRIYGPANPKVGVCTPYLVTEEDSQSISASAFTNAPLNIHITGSSGGTLHHVSNCSDGGSTSFTMSDLQRAIVIYYEAANPGSPGWISVDVSGVLSGFDIPVTPSP